MSITNLIRNSGKPLAPFRITYRALRRLSFQLNTYWWRLHLKNLGKHSIVELGVSIEQPTQVSIGNNCRIGAGSILTAEKNGEELIIADNVSINNNVRLDHTGGLKIGKGTLISDEALIYSHSHGLDPKSEPIGIPKIIGDKVWVGVRAIILEKCNMIPDNTIIAAGSITTKAIEESGVFAGNPARKIK